MSIIKRTTIILAVILGVATVAQAQNINYTLLSSSQKEAVVRVDFGTYHTDTVNVNGEVMQTLHMESAYPILKAGRPELLQSAFSLIIPEGSQPVLEVIDAQYSEISHFILAPSKGNLYRNVNPADIPYQKNESYLSDNYLLENAAITGETYQLRDYQGINIKVYPFDYNPSQRTLKAYSSITVKVTFNGEKSIASPQKNNRTFNAIYTQQFLNYKTLRSAPVTEEGDILIIAPEMFIEAMQPFADWKIKNGYNTEIVSLDITGNHENSIKSFITNYYNEHNLAFVVIVGDDAQFPTPSIDQAKADNFYTEIVGNDAYPDIILGKISAENVAQVQTQVQRFIEYERNPSETSHFPSFMGIASKEGPGDNNEYDYQHVRNIDNKLLDYTYTSGYELFEGTQGGLDASGNPSDALVASAVNSGVGIITYCGHGNEQAWGTSSFNNADVNNLTNIGKLPFIISVACLNGQYSSYNCFAESWLRATHNDQPAGAVCFIGSTINQSWNPPMCGQDAMIDYLVGTSSYDQQFTLGGMVFNGMIKMIDVYSTSGVEISRTWILFGDPTLMIRTAVPQPLEVFYNEILPSGTPSTQFTSAVENAKITVTKNGEIISTGRIENSAFLIDFPEAYTSTDTLHVVASATNYLPFEGIITFIPDEGPFVLVGDLSMTEVQTPWSTQVNGLPEYGETLTITPALINLGNDDADNIHVIVSTDDPYITLYDTDFIIISNIPAKDTLWNGFSFNCKLSDVVPANHCALLKIMVTYNNDTICTHKNFTCYAPNPVITSLNINDFSSGNGNGRVDFGETFNCEITITNIGNLRANSNTLFLTNPANELTFESTTVSVPVVEPGNSVTVSIQASVNDIIQTTTITYLTATLYVHEYCVSTYFPIKIGAIVEDWETGDFSNRTWQNYSGNYRWTIVTTSPYEGSYCARSGYTENLTTSRLSIAYSSTISDSISFYYKVSSEEHCDILSFKIDNQTMGEWSGEKNWTRASFPVSEGDHTFSWIYKKNYSRSEGEDCAYLDLISFPGGVVNVPISIEEYAQNAPKISVWPNPTTDFIHMQLSDDTQNYSYQLFNMNGKLLQGGQLFDNYSDIDVRHLATGTYILKVEDKQHHIQTTKIIKQ